MRHKGTSLKTAHLRMQQLALSLPVRTDLHLARKLWHSSMGFMIVAVYSSGISKALALSLLGFFFVFDVTMEWLRLRNPSINEKITKIFAPLLRGHEVHKLSTIPYYIAAAFFAVAVFPKPVAVLSLLYLAFGDPAASLFGVLYKGRSIKIFENKSLHGTLASFTICALITYFYLLSGGLVGINLIRLTLLGGFAGAIAEAIPLDIDDNFSIPVVSGFIMWTGFLLIQFV